MALINFINLFKESTKLIHYIIYMEFLPEEVKESTKLIHFTIFKPKTKELIYSMIKMKHQINMVIFLIGMYPL